MMNLKERLDSLNTAYLKALYQKVELEQRLKAMEEAMMRIDGAISEVNLLLQKEEQT